MSIGFLRRVEAINRTSREIVSGNLTERVPLRATGDEFDRLTENLNQMLDRIQALMDSLRQVSSDIAHDLRTPLSRLRQRLEGARLKAHSVAEYETAVERSPSLSKIIPDLTLPVSAAQRSLVVGSARLSYAAINCVTLSI
jgi:signal transduction histidine kinase